MNFKNIPGHTSQIKEWTSLVNADRIPHAWLLLGPNGSATLPMAIALANYIQCEKKEGDSCGVCRSCIKSSKWIHPDIHFTYPVVKKDNLKREDTISKHFSNQWRSFLTERPFDGIKSWINYISSTTTFANINTAECNDISHKLGMQSFEGKYKIQIIWMAEYLAKDSNRLLKLIEEPTDNTIIILIAENQNKLLPTIISRCQTFRVPKFSDQEIGSYLDTLSLDASINKEEIKHLAFGDIEKARKLSENTQTKYADMLLDWMRISWKSHPQGIFDFVNKLAQNSKEEIKMFFEYGLHFLREYLVYLYTKDTFKMRLSDREKNTALQMVKTINVEKAQALSLLFEESLGLIDRNINVKILFSENSFQLERIMKSK